MNQEVLQKYIAGNATPEEKDEVTRWLDADKKHMKEFLAVRKLYDISIWHEEPALHANRELPVGKAL